MRWLFTATPPCDISPGVESKFSRLMKRKIGFVVVAVVAIAVGWILYCTAPAPRPRCRMTLTVVSITNDGSGIRQVTFGLTNVGRHAVALVPAFGLENLSGEWRTNAMPPKAMTLRTNLWGFLPFHPKSKLLAPGESYEAKVTLPFDDRRWRASCWYIEVLTPSQQALDDLSTDLRLRNKQIGNQIVSTDWMEQ